MSTPENCSLSRSRTSFSSLKCSVRGLISRGIVHVDEGFASFAGHHGYVCLLVCIWRSSLTSEGPWIPGLGVDKSSSSRSAIARKVWHVCILCLHAFCPALVHLLINFVLYLPGKNSSDEVFFFFWVGGGGLVSRKHCVKITQQWIRRLGFQTYWCHQLAVWPWERHLVQVTHKSPS